MEESRNYQRAYRLNSEQTEKLCDSISTLGKSFNDVTTLEEREDREGKMTRYNNLSSMLMEKFDKIEIPEEFRERSEITQEMKDITFTKYKVQHDCQ